MDILIVSWNNLGYLQRCVETAILAADKPVNIYVHLNEGTDGSREYLLDSKIPFTSTPDNIGLPLAVQYLEDLSANSAIPSKDLFLVDDDIYFIEGWDTEFYDFKKKNKIPKDYLLCPTMIEPWGQNPLTISPWTEFRDPNKVNHGSLVRAVNDNGLRHARPSMYTDVGPFFISRSMFNKIGGYSIQYSPAIGTDNDITKKAWDTGYHDIVNIPRCLVYHYTSASTNRLKDREQQARKRDETFMQQHGMTVSDFQKNHLKKGKLWTK